METDPILTQNRHYCSEQCLKSRGLPVDRCRFGFPSRSSNYERGATTNDHRDSVVVTNNNDSSLVGEPQVRGLPHVHRVEFVREEQ
jgi:hypothetical protein